MVDFAVTTFGGLDILVNNAGIVDPAFLTPRPRRGCVFWTNLRGPMLGTYYAIRAMRDRGGGAIVNIASLAGVGFGPHPAGLRRHEGRRGAVHRRARIPRRDVRDP